MDGYKGPTSHPQKIHEDLLIWFHCGKGFVVGIWRERVLAQNLLMHVYDLELFCDEAKCPLTGISNWERITPTSIIFLPWIQTS